MSRPSTAAPTRSIPRSGRVIEFRNEEIEKLQRDVAERLGYRLIEHRLELFAVPIDSAHKAERK